MCRIKKALLVLTFLFFCIAYTQEKETVYLNFDLNSKEMCKTLKDGGGYLDIKKYQKIKSQSKKSNYRFYICDELFLFKRGLKPDTCTIKYLKNIKISNLINLKIEVNKINPLYPYKVFPNLYLVEKINDSIIVKYKVKWEYYIE